MMDYDKISSRKDRREGKTSEELLKLFESTYYRTERAGRLEEGCFVDIMVTDHCNLNCSGCDHFGPLAKPYYLDIETYEDQLIRLKKILPQASIIALWGGEPLLHPNIKEIVKISRKIFSNADIMIGSNGVLIEKLSNDTLDTLYENNVGFQISRYLKDGDTIYTGLDRLKEKNIHFSFSEYRNFFQAITVDPSGSQDPTQWYTCSRCNMPMLTYRNYKLYKCAFGACSRAMGEKGIEIPEIEGEDYLLLTNDDLKPEDVFTFVFKPSNKCKYCKEVYINSGFVHQVNYSKKAQYLFDMKDLFMYYYNEYKKYSNNDISMNFMKDHIVEEMAWDTSFNPDLDRRIKNRYYFGEYDIIIEINDIDEENFDIFFNLLYNYNSKHEDNKYVFYIIVNNVSLQMEEKIYKEFAANTSFLNAYLYKRDMFESLLDVYKFVLENSYSENVVFCYDYKNYKEYKRDDLKTLPFFDVSANLPYYFDLTNLPLDVQEESQVIERMIYEYLYIIYSIYNDIFKKEDYIAFLNNENVLQDEDLLSLKILLSLDIKEKISEEEFIEIFNSNELTNIGVYLYSNFLNKKNIFIKTNGHTTFDKDSLELKILSILNKKYDIRILNSIKTYVKSRKEREYFDKLLLS